MIRDAGSRYSQSWLLDNLSCCSIAIHCYSLHCHWGESQGGSAHLSLILRFNKLARDCSPNGRVVGSSCFVAQDARFPVGGASISRLVNGMVQRMPGSPIMDRILTRHQLEEGKRRDWGLQLNSQVRSAHRSPQKASGHGLTPCNGRITQNWQHLGPTQNSIWLSDLLFLLLFWPSMCPVWRLQNVVSELWLNTRIRSRRKTWTNLTITARPNLTQISQDVGLVRFLLWKG